MSNNYWLWYPGDFELYHALQQDFSRVERGFGWPAFWKSEGFRNRIVIWREYDLSRSTEFQVHANGIGFIRLNGEKYLFDRKITCGPGKVMVVIHVGRIEALPSVYVEGDIIRSDEGWMAEDYDKPPVPAGHSKYFTRPDQDPAVWNYSEKTYLPIRTERCQDGFLYEFETELTAVLQVSGAKEDTTIYYGESREEALDTAHCYYSWKPDPDTGKCPRSAVRFAYIPGEEVELKAIHQYVDIPVKASFRSSDTLLNRIWETAEHTFRLCSGIFFIDGVKRDKWIWSGDAYQSLFVNRYLMADPDIDQRTLLALRGNDPMTTHINTIVDYSLYWILGIQAHYDAYQDMGFLEQVYPKMVSLMAFCESRTEEHGFIVGQGTDWTFIDWANLDKDGPLGAEQMLLAACWRTMAEISRLLGKDEQIQIYEKKWTELCRKIDQYYWDGTREAYIDSFTSGKRHVTRQTNLFALLFHIADAEKQEKIYRSVITNKAVAPITTPYFNFFALDALGQMGCLEQVLDSIRSYWGGMLERGAVTFWEEFDPSVTGAAQYDMYGDKFGKSLCHAWSASPIYLISRYFVGLELNGPEGTDFVLTPHLEYFDNLDCTLPVGAKGDYVHILWDGQELQVRTSCRDGILQLGDKQILLNPETVCKTGLSI